MAGRKAGTIPGCTDELTTRVATLVRSGMNSKAAARTVSVDDLMKGVKTLSRAPVRAR